MQTKRLKWFYLYHVVFLVLSNYLYAQDLNSESMPRHEPIKRNMIHFTGGMYSFKGVNKNISSPGSLQIGYTYHVTPKWSGHVTYNSLLQTTGNIGSIINGFDFGASYCFFTCVPKTTLLSDVVAITEGDRIGLRFGLGFSNRSFSLTTSTVSFSGLYQNVTVNYYIKNNFKLLLSAYNSTITNADKKISYQTYSLGIGFDFGTGPVDWISGLFK